VDTDFTLTLDAYKAKTSKVRGFFFGSGSRRDPGLDRKAVFCRNELSKLTGLLRFSKAKKLVTARGIFGYGRPAEAKNLKREVFKPRMKAGEKYSFLDPDPIVWAWGLRAKLTFGPRWCSSGTISCKGVVEYALPLGPTEKLRAPGGEWETALPRAAKIGWQAGFLIPIEGAVLFGGTPPNHPDETILVVLRIFPRMMGKVSIPEVDKKGGGSDFHGSECGIACHFVVPATGELDAVASTWSRGAQLGAADVDAFREQEPTHFGFMGCFGTENAAAFSTGSWYYVKGFETAQPGKWKPVIEALEWGYGWLERNDYEKRQRVFTAEARFPSRPVPWHRTGKKAPHEQAPEIATFSTVLRVSLDAGQPPNSRNVYHRLEGPGSERDGALLLSILDWTLKCNLKGK
jgi:hypothetical protein